MNDEHITVTINTSSQNGKVSKNMTFTADGHEELKRLLSLSGIEYDFEQETEVEQISPSTSTEGGQVFDVRTLLNKLQNISNGNVEVIELDHADSDCGCGETCNCPNCQAKNAQVYEGWLDDEAPIGVADYTPSNDTIEVDFTEPNKNYKRDLEFTEPRHDDSTLKFDYRVGDHVDTPLGTGTIIDMYRKPHSSISDADDIMVVVKHDDYNDHDGDTFELGVGQIKHHRSDSEVPGDLDEYNDEIDGANAEWDYSNNRGPDVKDIDAYTHKGISSTDNFKRVNNYGDNPLSRKVKESIGNLLENDSPEFFSAIQKIKREKLKDLTSAEISNLAASFINLMQLDENDAATLHRLFKNYLSESKMKKDYLKYLKKQ